MASREYFGDLKKTENLLRIFEIPKEKRDDAWIQEFLANVTDASFRTTETPVILGPDGFPYFQLFSPVPGQTFQCFVVKEMVKDFILEEGFGISINPAGGNPDWVFTAGDLVNFNLRGQFYSRQNPKKNGQGFSSEIIEKDQKVLISQPSENYLPKFTREHIKLALSNLGMNQVKVFLMDRMDQDAGQELVFNLTPEQFSDVEYKRAMTIISWFLPRHYSISGINEEGSFAQNFVLL